MGEAVEARQTPLDVITIGRASVDLYGQQTGSRLEDITSFAKSVGGCPANISVGTARLGLRSALLTRVGDEQMGRFIREQLRREGVSVDGLKTDKDRLTALVLLSVEEEGVSPMIFYRSDCADMALAEEDIDEAFIASARSIVVTGTHFSRPNSDAAQRKAIRIMKAKGGKVVFDIDYRPNLWGLAGHAEGFERYVKSDRVSAQLKTVLPDCDLIVGTEEEIMIASGADDCLSALKTIRSLSKATIVLKRGAMGCIVYDGPISDDLEDGIVGKGFPIEVYNVLGAGDAFMSGFLRGWLGGENLATAATWANACGAFAVSRLLCAPEYPTFEELQFFLKHGSKHLALRKDEAINHIHWATTRRRDIPSLMALAMRPSRPARGRRGQGWRRCLAHRGFQGAGGQGGRQGGCRSRRLWHAARRKIRPRGDVRVRPPYLRLARPPGRIAGLAAAALRILAGHRLATGRMASRALHQVPVLLSSRRSRGAEDGAAAEAARAVRGRAEGRPRTSRRDHRRQAWQARRHDDPARAGRTLCARHQARLVEARAAGFGDCLGRRSRR